MSAVLTLSVPAHPARESSDFLLLAGRSAILCLPLTDIESGVAPMPLPLSGIANVVALEYDRRRNCLYWADYTLDHVAVRRGWFYVRTVVGN